MRDRDDIVIIAWAVWWGLLAFLVAAALVYVTVRPARAELIRSTRPTAPYAVLCVNLGKLVGVEA